MSTGMLTGLGALALAIVFLALLILREGARRRAWFAAADAALGEDFGPFVSPEDLSDSLASEGRIDGAKARFAADNTTTHARLEVALPDGVDRGAVFDFVVRESRNAIETGTEAVTAGYDLETERIVVKERATPDAAATVRALVEEARAFQAALPSLLAKRAEKVAASEKSVMGELAGEGGRHAKLGIGLALPSEEWERARVGSTAIEWERNVPEGSQPATLRLAGVPQDPALGEPAARDRLLGRLALVFVEGLPDGSFEEAAPVPSAVAVEPVDGLDAHEATVDFLCEIDVREGETERRPYRYVARAIFAPWAVVVVSVEAPRDEAVPLLDRALSGATLVAPADGTGPEP
ncbi:hypothetical protein HY251_19170 [bacterium]|nr:hypothetical protein [bacterium]